MTPRAQAFPAALAMTPLSEAHAETVVRWRNDPANRAMFFSDGELSLASQLAWTRRQRDDPLDHTYVALWGAEPVGMVAVYGVDTARRTGEYGRILVDQAWRRQGIGRAISGWITALGFQSLGLEQIHASCLAANRPIQTLLHSLGFRPVGTWRHVSGREAVRMEVTVAEWRRLGLSKVYEPALNV